MTFIHRRILLAVLGVGLFVQASASADAIYATAGTTGTIELKGISLVRLEGTRLVYRTSTGTETSKDLLQVQRIAVDDEPALTAAETAYAGQQFDKAVDDYLRFQRGATKAWLKAYSGPKLLECAAKTNRLDAAVTAYIDLAQTDLKTAQSLRPKVDTAKLPKAGVLDAAAGEVDKALAKSGLNAETKKAFLSLLIELRNAKGDSVSAAKALEQLTALGGGPTDGSAQAAVADVRLKQASTALDAKDYAKAAAIIEQSKATFTEPRQQADALFLLAAAREGEARASKDTTRMKDAALAYMRVVAHFRSEPLAASRVANATLRTAQILEDIGDKAPAKQLYTELAAGTDSIVKEQARMGLERLK